MIKALLWKEWCHNRWKLVFSCVIMGAFVTTGFKARITSDEAIIIPSMVLCSLLMPMFVAMGTIGAETERGTLSMQLGLAVQAWKVYIVKLAVGAAVVTGPFLLGMILAIVITGGREISIGAIMKVYGCGMSFAISFFLWTVVFSMRCGSEAKGALASAGIFFGWAIFILIDDMLLAKTPLRAISMAITPLGFFEWGMGNGKWPVVTITQLVISIVLFLWGMMRFAGLAGRQK